MSAQFETVLHRMPCNKITIGSVIEFAGTFFAKETEKRFAQCGVERNQAQILKVQDTNRSYKVIVLCKE